MNSRTWGFAVTPTFMLTSGLTLWLTASLASAQPAPGGPPAPAGEPVAAPPPPPPMNAPAEEADTGRPTELSIAIGVGYAFPTSLQTPNITSVRLRLPSGLTLEP